MIKEVTNRQKELLAIIYEYIQDTGYPPTFEEMRQRLAVSSNQSVIDLLEKLEDLAAIRRNEGSARSITITPLGSKILNKVIFPVVGITAAGAFTESFSEVDFQWVEISSSLNPEEKIEQSDDVFIVRVRGDSMINAGINDGDMLLVRKAKEYKSGDVVVARNDEGTTVKKFIADGGKRYLKPENPAYANIPIVPGEILFEGKVILNLSQR